MRLSLFILLVAGIMFSCSSDSIEPEVVPCDDLVHETSSYDTNIKGIINRTCAYAGCHVIGANARVYTSFAGIKSDLENGDIAKQVFELRLMPQVPPTDPKYLTDDEFELLQCWYDNGFREK